MKKCKLKIYDESGYETQKVANFHGIFQKSYIVEPSPMIGGSSGGVVAYPVAVVELDDGPFAVSLEYVGEIYDRD